MRKGQSTVEYMLTMSVVSLAIIATMWSFTSVFRTGVQTLSSDMATDTLTTQGVQP